MTARKRALVLWVQTWKKTVVYDRAGIKHLTLKFRGPVGLGGMNKRWKNELLKEHWPKSWMCSSHVVMVCYCCWNCQEESVKKRGQKNAFFIARGSHPGRMAWIILIGRNIKIRNSMAKIIPALINNLKIVLSAKTGKFCSHLSVCVYVDILSWILKSGCANQKLILSLYN